MRIPVKIVILSAFFAFLYWVIQSTVTAALAYYTLFPLCVLVTLHLFETRPGLALTIACALFFISYSLSGLNFLFRETIALVAVTVGFAGLLIYYLSIWRKEAEREEEQCNKIRQEVQELKEKHGIRVESLFHLEKQVASLINLFEIARDFNECLDLKETAQILYKKVLPEVGFESSELILVDPDKEGPRLSKAYCMTRLGVEEKETIPEDAPERQWLAEGIQKGAMITTENAWIFPLMLEGEFNGLFVAQGAQKEDLAKFEVLTSQLALQVRKIRLYEMVKELSIIDGLTGVFVRRHFLERFEEELRRAVKHNFPLSVLMLDIDHFKRYNDQFGHLVGDATLKEVAQVIRGNVRTVDIVARYGGEEFAVVIPETREEGAAEVAERIRSAVARRSFKVYDEETKVTVSIGISVFPQDVSRTRQGFGDPNLRFELLQKADRALYRAKEEGRNRVMTHRALGIV